MTTPLHDDEPDTSQKVVHALLSEQAPELCGLALEPLNNTGSDNALYRLGTDLVVRLPRRPGAARGLEVELAWLPRLHGLPVAVPRVRHAGEANSRYPYRWAVLRWLGGTDAWEARSRHGWFGPALGHDLAAFVRDLRSMPILDAPPRQPGQRGGPLAALDDQLRWWLDHADGLVDTRAVGRLWEQCLEGVENDVQPSLVHGDLIPGNLLVADGRLAAVLDWGGLGAGDPALDLIPAWTVLDPVGALAFREELEVDETSWLRARGFALEQAIGGVIYYRPRRHPLGDVMQRTLDRLLS